MFHFNVSKRKREETIKSQPKTRITTIMLKGHKISTEMNLLLNIQVVIGKKYKKKNWA